MKKQIKKIVSLILAATVLFSVAAIGMSASAVSVEGERYYITTDGMTSIGYTVTGGEARITDFVVAERDASIPETVDDYPVTSVDCIDEYVYDSVYIPASVEKIIGLSTEKYIVDENNPNFSTDEHGVLFDKNKETLLRYPAANTAKEYEVPETVKYIGEGAFMQALFLENIVLNEGLLEIDEYAFAETYSLKTVNIPSTVTRIDNSAFYYCRALEFISVDKNNAYYTNDEYGVLFSKDMTKLYKYPSCAPAESYVIPDSVKQTVFQWYGPTLRAFDTFKNLKEITISASMDSVSSYGFQKFEKINVSPDNPYYTSIDGVVYSKDGTEIVRYPVESKVTCFYYPEEVTSKEYYFNQDDAKYLASIVYNSAFSEGVTPIEDGEEFYSWEPSALTDVYFMGDGESFERTKINTYNNKTITYHYNCKPDDHFHDYKFEVTTAPTCGNKGSATLTCSCGKVVITEIANSGFHSLGSEWEEIEEKICCKSIKGDVIKCIECGGYGFAIKLTHIPEQNLTTTYISATEDTEGSYKQVCNDCGEVVEEGTIGIGHKIIIFRSNGYDFVRQYDPGEVIKYKYYPEKENAEFIGWADENGNIVELPETMPDKDVKYTAIFRNVQKAEGFDVTATFDDGCFDADVEFSVKEIDGESKLGDVYMEDGKYFYQIGFYNIKMLGENGETVQPNSGKTVTVKMRIPDEYKNKTEFVITHWFAEGGREKLSVSNKLAWIEEGYLCFTVSKFSEFAIHVPVSGTVEMASAPAKTSYYYKEELDLSGIKFVVAGEEGTLEEITDTSEMKVSGYDPNTVGEQTVTVECRGVTEEFKVTVSYAWWQWIIRILLLGFLWY